MVENVNTILNSLMINSCHNISYITTEEPVKNLVHSYPSTWSHATCLAKFMTMHSHWNPVVPGSNCSRMTSMSITI
uniref:Uncharacterized protein n=1 Tax=Arundo donax TaxID=35708 RepID=A0A0A9D5F2_ARUDO